MSASRHELPTALDTTTTRYHDVYKASPGWNNLCLELQQMIFEHAHDGFFDEHMSCAVPRVFGYNSYRTIRVPKAFTKLLDVLFLLAGSRTSALFRSLNHFRGAILIRQGPRRNPIQRNEFDVRQIHFGDRQAIVASYEHEIFCSILRQVDAALVKIEGQVAAGEKKT